MTSTIEEITDTVTALRRLLSYFADNRYDLETITKATLINLNRNAVIETDKKIYYLKFDSKFWFNAGMETGKFSGPGFTINKDVYDNVVNHLRADILYVNKPNLCYHFKIENYRNNAVKHVQKFNNESVMVISIYKADGVWYI